jgi:hypothetical protein
LNLIFGRLPLLTFTDKGIHTMQLSSTAFNASAARGNIQPFDIEANAGRAPGPQQTQANLPARRRTPPPGLPRPGGRVTSSSIPVRSNNSDNFDWDLMIPLCCCLGVVAGGAVMLAIGLRQGSLSTSNIPQYDSIPPNCTEWRTLETGNSTMTYQCLDELNKETDNNVPAGGFLIAIGSVSTLIFCCMLAGCD